MPKPANIDRPVRLTTTFPESIRARLDLHLFSEVEGRVPYGAYQEFLIARTREFFDSEELDLTPFGFPTGFAVRGDKEVVKKLKEFLLSEVVK